MPELVRSTLYAALFSLVALQSVTGCSSRQAYESIRSAHRFECGKLPAAQQRECLEQQPGDYEDYLREREKVKNGN